MITHTRKTVTALVDTVGGKIDLKCPYTWSKITKAIETIAANHDLTCLETMGDFDVTDGHRSEYEDSTVVFSYNCPWSLYRVVLPVGRYQTPEANYIAIAKYLKRKCLNLQADIKEAIL